MTKFVIFNTDTHKYLSYVGLACNRIVVEPVFDWTAFTFSALILNQEEAEATIDFIRDVLDCELSNSLEVMEVQQ